MTGNAGDLPQSAGPACVAAAGGLVMSRAQALPRFELGPDDGTGTKPLVLPWRATLADAVRAIGGGQSAEHLETWVSGGIGMTLETSARGMSINMPDGPPYVDGELLRGRVVAILDQWDRLANEPMGSVVPWGVGDKTVIDAASGTAVPPPSRLVPRTIADAGKGAAGDICLIDDAGSVTWAELAALAADYAAGLWQAGLGPGDVAAVALPRNRHLIAAYLGVWHVGAAFAPVDATHPAARVARQLEAVGARAVVGDPGNTLPGPLPRIRPVRGSSAPEHRHSPGELAYVMCTSGSTGEPKAVGVSHGALAGCVEAFRDVLGDGRRTAYLTGSTFDISLLEFTYPLTTDGVLLVVGDARRRDPANTTRWLLDQRADLIQATPSAWSLMTDALGEDMSHTVLLCGGEALAPDLAARLTATGAQVWNCYGPTEATIWATVQPLTSETTGPVSIGRPLPGTTAHVLSGPGLVPVAVGEPGELYIGGRQLAVGYLGRDDLTAEAFVTHPVHGRVYRTGDICSWRDDGTLRFHGREDGQVKVRGHRVELVEIDAAVESHPKVRRAATLLSGEGETASLLCCLEPADGAYPDATELRTFIAGLLPGAWVPARFAIVDELPRTSSGKVDRRALTALASNS
ncbi:amino acid adenylation domain-containing protein [Streptomyces sp. NPDC058665]|uniref:amino acid adenylation domain-containing protein n=1 Tax=Streptomyces sp. NPDC058665 TaxID=3346586 RepID=UPI00365BC983